MKFDQFVKQLGEQGHTGSNLYKLAEDQYITVPYAFGTDYEGFMIVKLDDGPHIFPYSAVMPEHEYEQLDPAGYAKATPELVLVAVNQLRQKADDVMKFMAECVY